MAHAKRLTLATSQRTQINAAPDCHKSVCLTSSSCKSAKVGVAGGQSKVSATPPAQANSASESSLSDSVNQPHHWFSAWSCCLQVQMVKPGDASMASPFTAKQGHIMPCTDILKQGRSTLVTTVQMFKILGLLCLSTAYSLSVMYLQVRLTWFIISC